MQLPIAEFTAAAGPMLEAVGLTKRTSDCYTTEVASEFLGVVSLGRATAHASLRIWPIVGVRHQPTEATLAELVGYEAHPYLPPTISCGLGYVMPEKRWVEWTVEDAVNADARARQIAVAIESFGLPAIHENASMEAILRALNGRRPLTRPRPDYLLPVVLANLRRQSEADGEIARGLEERQGRTDPEADQYRAFVRAFRRWQTALE